MGVERTLSIIKPDAVAKNVIGQIYARFEGSRPEGRCSASMAHLSRGEAEAVLRSSQGTSIFQGSGGFHDLRPRDDSGVWKVKTPFCQEP